MHILHWLWEGFGYGEVAPSVVYWTLRLLMLTLSIVLEEWAVQELLPSPRARCIAVLLVTSSYVTWTFQTHTFSNSLETLLVSWSLVLIKRIVEDKVHLEHLIVDLVRVRANHNAEALRRPSFVPLGLLGRLGNLQSHYLSSLSSTACVQPAATLSAEVSIPALSLCIQC
jgi:hypothetical protein